MNFKDYQNKSKSTAIYPRVGNNVYYPALALAGEAGEVANKVSKIMRDFNDKVTDDMRHALEKELGDVLWNLSQLATELDLSLDKIAENNLNKLQKRKENNSLHGSGDNRI